MTRLMRNNGIDWWWCNLCGWVPFDEPWDCFFTGQPHAAPTTPEPGRDECDDGATDWAADLSDSGDLRG